MWNYSLKEKSFLSKEPSTFLEERRLMKECLFKL